MEGFFLKGIFSSGDFVWEDLFLGNHFPGGDIFLELSVTLVGKFPESDYSHFGLIHSQFLFFTNHSLINKMTIMPETIQPDYATPHNALLYMWEMIAY